MTGGARIALCELDEIPDGGSAGFAVPGPDGGMLGVMATRQGDRVYLYENSCPHIGTPLDFTPGQFLDLERAHFLCSTHGALFRITDGHCISGPCAGDNLTPIKAELADDMVYVRITAPP